MTDSLVRKDMFGQTIGKGFMPDVHCPTGAPRESIVKITKAEPGGIGGQGLWRPAALGLRPSYESETMQRYLEGEFNPDGDGRQGRESLMARVHNWQIGREMSYWYPGVAPEEAVRRRLRHQQVHRLPDLHAGLQDHVDLGQGPGVHAVEQRRERSPTASTRWPGT